MGLIPTHGNEIFKIFVSKGGVEFRHSTRNALRILNAISHGMCGIQREVIKLFRYRVTGIAVVYNLSHRDHAGSVGQRLTVKVMVAGSIMYVNYFIY